MKESRFSRPVLHSLSFFSQLRQRLRAARRHGGWAPPPSCSERFALAVADQTGLKQTLYQRGAMKYFLIGTVNGAPLYFDHAQGRMLIPPLTTMQEVLEEGFKERASFMEAELEGRRPVRLVTHKWQGYVLAVVSDEGEQEIHLQAQLYTIFRLLQMMFGPTALLKKQSTFFLKHKRHLQNLIDLNSIYSRTNQSSLVHAAEHVELNGTLFKQCQVMCLPRR